MSATITASHVSRSFALSRGAALASRWWVMIPSRISRLDERRAVPRSAKNTFRPSLWQTFFRKVCSSWTNLFVIRVTFKNTSQWTLKNSFKSTLVPKTICTIYCFTSRYSYSKLFSFDNAAVLFPYIAWNSLKVLHVTLPQTDEVSHNFSVQAVGNLNKSNNSNLIQLFTYNKYKLL